MKEILIDELKELQLQILKQVDSFCRENGIKYFLCAGSLIGAIRHHGYIPWDDDIDIMMLREDYNKFLNIFNGRVHNLCVKAPELDWNYYAPYANVFDTRTLIDEGENGHLGEDIGIKIDIFPYDALPKNDFVYKITQWIVLKFNSILRVKRLKKSFGLLTFKQKINKIFFFFIPYSLLQKCIYYIAISNSKNKEADVFLRTYDIKTLMRARKEIFEKCVYEKFEDSYFPIPVYADEYLKIRFGDYMKLPPKEKQVSHHNFKAYWK